MKPFFAYIRVSTQRQGEHGVSLQEQRDAIERYATREGFEVSRWFEERQTAAKQGRPIFKDLLMRLRRGEASGVLIHKIDRSARNLKDWTDVEGLSDDGIAVHFANEGLDLTSLGGRLAADVQAVVAAHYVRNLREEAKKGIYGRFKQGILPLPAPIGYLNRGAGNPKAIDPIKGPLVRRAFELYASGAFTLKTLKEKLLEIGFSNRGGGPPTRNGLATMLRNPFYIGLIRVRKTGEIFQGAHDPLITKGLFDKVQEVLNGRISARPDRHVFVFRRFLKCRKCGYSLIGESRKGHTYYRCHTETCATSVREEAVDLALREQLKPVTLHPDELTYLEGRLRSIRTEWFERRKFLLQNLKLQIADLGKRLSRLTDALLDGTLEKDLFTEKKNSLILDRRGLEDQLNRLERNPDAVLQEVQEFLGLARDAYFLYESALSERRRQLALLLTSDRTVDGKCVVFTLAPAAAELTNRRTVSSGGPRRYRPRTLDMILERLIKLFEERSTSEDYKQWAA